MNLLVRQDVPREQENEKRFQKLLRMLMGQIGQFMTDTYPSQRFVINQMMTLMSQISLEWPFLVSQLDSLLSLGSCWDSICLLGLGSTSQQKAGLLWSMPNARAIKKPRRLLPLWRPGRRSLKTTFC